MSTTTNMVAMRTFGALSQKNDVDRIRT